MTPDYSSKLCIVVRLYPLQCTDMTYRLLSLSGVSAARRNQPKSTVYRDIGLGLLTPPVKMGHSSAWPEHEIAAINGAIIRGASEEEIRQLVRDLLAARTKA